MKQIKKKKKSCLLRKWINKFMKPSFNPNAMCPRYIGPSTAISLLGMEVSRGAPDWCVAREGFYIFLFFCLEEQRELKQAGEGCLLLLLAPTIPKGQQPAQLCCPLLWPEELGTSLFTWPAQGPSWGRRCQKCSCPLVCACSSWSSRGIQGFCNSLILSP